MIDPKHKIPVLFRPYSTLEIKPTVQMKDKIDYAAYLKSEHWEMVKLRIYSIYKKCQYCGETNNLNIHHLTYERIGNELDDDLIVLCDYCHIEGVHKGNITKEELLAIKRKEYIAPVTPVRYMSKSQRRKERRRRYTIKKRFNRREINEEDLKAIEREYARYLEVLSKTKQ